MLFSLFKFVDIFIYLPLQFRYMFHFIEHLALIRNLKIVLSPALCVPFVIAYRKRKKSKVAILIFSLINLLVYIASFTASANGHYVLSIFYLDLSVLLYVTVLIWSLLPAKDKKQIMLMPTISPVDELDKLLSLKERGAITAEEYEVRKQKILNT